MFCQRRRVFQTPFTNRASLKLELHGLFQLFVDFGEGVDRELEIFA
jgi:hypothetical protein